MTPGNPLSFLTRKSQRLTNLDLFYFFGGWMDDSCVTVVLSRNELSREQIIYLIK